jgi:hypothetical protein
MGFVFPVFLWAVAVVAIPVLIHLFYFRRYKKVFFSSTRFLKEVKEKQKKAGRLQELLVLACRILAVIFLVLAFAQPFLGQRSAVGLGSGKAVVIYIDNTFSMSLLSGTRPLLSDAKGLAKKLLENLGPGDRVMLLNNDLDGSLQRWMSPQEAMPILEDIRLSSSVKPLMDILTRMAVIFKDVPGRDQLAYFISDFQDYALPASWPEMEFESILLPVQADGQSNLYIDSCWLADPVVYRQATNKMVVRTKNSGPADASSQLILQLEGETRAVADISIPSNAERIDTLSFNLRQSGWQKGKLLLQDFPVTFDNQMHFAFEAAVSNRVLLMEEVASGRAVYNVFHTDAHFAVDKLEASRADLNRLSEFNLVVLNELTSISKGMAAALQQYVTAGGSLYIIPSSDASTSDYNNLLSALGTGLLSEKVKSGAKVLSINENEPIVQAAFTSFPRNLDLPQVQLYFPIGSAASAAERTVLKLDNGRSYLSTYQVGAGVVYLQASALQSDATDFATKAIFPPLIYNMAVFKASPRPMYFSIGAPQFIKGLEAVSGAEQVFRMKSGAYEFIPPVRPSGNRLTLAIPADLEQDGVFEILRGDQVLDVAAVNFSRRESEMKMLSGAALADRFANDRVSIATAGDLLQGAGIAGLDTASPLWKLCLILALLFLIAETLLLRFATPKATA